MVLCRGQVVTGAAMLTGSAAGGFVAQQTSLGVPFVLRGATLIVMFAVAFRLMHDIGFTPEKGGGALTVLGRAADAWGYAPSYLIGAGISILALPCLALSRRENAPADTLEVSETQATESPETASISSGAT